MPKILKGHKNTTSISQQEVLIQHSKTTESIIHHIVEKQWFCKGATVKFKYYNLVSSYLKSFSLEQMFKQRNGLHNIT